MNFSTVLIGIQARSTSKRLPGKCFEMIGDKRLLEHVIIAAKSASHYLNRHTDRSGILVKVALLVPTGDPIKTEFDGFCHIIQGSEDDVLGRYRLGADSTDADYIVRVTGDCPLIPDYVISQHINIATKNAYDYVSNTDEEYRTSLDGEDCEVISKRMLRYIDEKSTAKHDREHVTPYVRRMTFETKPDWAKIGTTIDRFDFSNIKYSVDSQDELETVRRQFNSRNGKDNGAISKYGKSNVHRV